ncbi:MAG: nucleotide exchange factor GrpE [Candidatus Omnitrophica bacterium]|nr:nucleotide exchange factor GrpE [Candidatus Omnitrophota bacterium]MCM8798020.1 nucleotide exchange factor GrpE [Candidatus Omnitrophota bacterium]
MNSNSHPNSKGKIKDNSSPKQEPGAEEKKLNISASEWEALQKKASLADEYYDKLLRLQAEFENARRRMLKEKEEIVQFANQSLLEEILPIVDDFEHFFNGLTENQIPQNIRVGIEMIQKRLTKVLEENGLTRMKVVGERFDPARHEALMMVETDAHPEDTIVEEIRSGYLLYDKVLRPAIVKVAKKKRETEPDISSA